MKGENSRWCFAGSMHCYSKSKHCATSLARSLSIALLAFWLPSWVVFWCRGLLLVLPCSSDLLSHWILQPQNKIRIPVFTFQPVVVGMSASFSCYTINALRAHDKCWNVMMPFGCEHSEVFDWDRQNQYVCWRRSHNLTLDICRQRKSTDWNDVSNDRCLENISQLFEAKIISARWVNAILWNKDAQPRGRCSFFFFGRPSYESSCSTLV